jgi:hypothetical protein
MPVTNLYKALKGLFPDAPLQVGNVIAIDNGVATIELDDGGRAQARGEVTVGDRVFFRDEVIEGPAPDLTLEIIEV